MTEMLERVAVYCDQQAAIERSEGESMCDPANFSAMRAYEEVAKFARGLLSASGADDDRKSLETIVRAVEINDGDTLSRIATDSKVIWTASGSWGGKQEVTLGDLRAVAKWYRESNPIPVYNIPQID